MLFERIKQNKQLTPNAIIILKKADLDNHSYKMYDKIEAVENQLISARAKKQSVEAEKRQYLQGAT